MINKLIRPVLLIFVSIIFIESAHADYPNTSIGVVDINIILSDSKAAKDAAKQIEKIAKEIEEEVNKQDENMLGEQNKLIESQAVMAPEAFESKAKEYEQKLQKYNIERQEKLITIDNLVAKSRNDVLEALKPILEEVSNERGITILLEKNSVLLNAEAMDITSEVLKKLDKSLPSLKVKRN